MRKKQEERETRAKINKNEQKTRWFFSFEAEAQLDLLPSVASTEQLLLSPFYITFPSSFSGDLGPRRELKRSQSPGTDSTSAGSELHPGRASSRSAGLSHLHPRSQVTIFQ